MNQQQSQSAVNPINNRLKYLSKLLSQKIHFQNFSLPLKKDIFKIAFSKNTFSKLLSQNIHFQNYSLQKYIFKTALSKFSKFLPEKT